MTWNLPPHLGHPRVSGTEPLPFLEMAGLGPSPRAPDRLLDGHCLLCQAGVSRETEPVGDTQKETHFRELAQAMVGWQVWLQAGPSGRTALLVWTQNAFFSRKPQVSLSGLRLHESCPHVIEGRLPDSQSPDLGC